MKIGGPYSVHNRLSENNSMGYDLCDRVYIQFKNSTRANKKLYCQFNPSDKQY